MFQRLVVGLIESIKITIIFQNGLIIFLRSDNIWECFPKEKHNIFQKCSDVIIKMYLLH